MRADKFFAQKYGSRTKAAEALKKGLVLCGGKALSPCDEVPCGVGFTFCEEKERFVSNGGYKLARAFEAFHESAEGGVFADLGASTGGFTDCLLQSGARHVFCVDVGENQLDPRIVSDARVSVMDKTNARYLTAADFPCPIDGIAGDLSFISLRLLLPAVDSVLPEYGKAFLLFKPQFECGKGALKKNGICPRRLHASLLGEFYLFARSLGLSPQDIVNAPVREKKNLEYIVYLKKSTPPISKEDFLLHAANLYEERR